MSQSDLGPVGDSESAFDRFVLKMFGIFFQLAEIMLIVGAFRYAGERTGSMFLTGFSVLLGFVGSMWLGLVIPSTVGRLTFWRRVSPRVRLAFALVSIGAGIWVSILYMQAITSIASAQGS